MRVAVIGGGVVGVCTAYFLADAGHQVTVIERFGNVAQEASFGNLDLLGPCAILPWAMPGTMRRAMQMLFKPESPMVFSGKFEPAMWRWLRRLRTESVPARFRANHHQLYVLASYSRELMDNLMQQPGIDFQQRSGMLLMLRDAKEAAQTRPLVEALTESGAACELLDPAAVRQLEPGLSENTPFNAALHLPDELSGNCPLFVRQLKKLAQEKGIEFRFNSAVESIQPQPAGVTLRMGEDDYHADAVVVAAGTGSIRLLTPIGVYLPTYPVRVYSASVPIQSYEGAPQRALLDERYRVAITRLGQRVRLAGCAEFGSSTVKLHQKAINTLARVGSDWFPGAANYRSASFWCGPTAMLPEGVPLLGATRYGNVFINVGHGSSAWALAAGSGKLVADLMSGRRPAIDTDGLSLNRYAEPNV